jgi:hypothetical protein
MERVGSMYKISTGKYKLIVIYNKLQGGLYSCFSSDKRMYEYIQNNLEEAFVDAIKYEGNNTFILNISSTENFGAFDWKNAKELLERQFRMFMPIIQKFMVDALTDSLEVEEQD